MKTRRASKKVIGLALCLALILTQLFVFSMPASAALKTEMFKNGEFDQELDWEKGAWFNYVDGAASAELVTVQDAEMSGENAFFANITSGGKDGWMIQFGQDAPAVEGKVYTLSFQAKAVEERPLEVKLQMDHDPWKDYAKKKFNITTETKTYYMTYIPKETDLKAEIKFILGGNDAGIYFDKISLKGPGKAKNYVLNGEFDEELVWDTNWFKYVHESDGSAACTYEVVNDAGMSGDNALYANITNGGKDGWMIQLINKAPIKQGMTYTMSFQAKAAEARKIAVCIQMNRDPWKDYAKQTFDITEEVQTYTYTFKANVTDPNAEIKFQLGGGGDIPVWFDDIKFTIK